MYLQKSLCNGVLMRYTLHTNIIDLSFDKYKVQTHYIVISPCFKPWLVHESSPSCLQSQGSHSTASKVVPIITTFDMDDLGDRKKNMDLFHRLNITNLKIYRVS